MNAHRVAFGVALGLIGGEAHAAPVTVWLTPDVPEERFTLKIDRKTGGAQHLDAVDLAFPPAPVGDVDQQHLDDLQAAVAEGKGRWDEFEVELPIARDLQLALEEIDLVRGDRDRFDLVQGLIFQGAAAVRAFEPDTFATEDIAAPFRADVGGAVVPKPWLDARALLGGEELKREDFIDGTAWSDYQRFSELMGRLEPAHLTLRPEVGKAWVDGAPAEGAAITLPPGRHYVHFVRDGVVGGRTVLDLKPGASVTVDGRVTDAELGEASAKVMLGSKTSFPEALVDALDALEGFYGGPVFVAAVEGNRSMVVPWSRKAVLVDARLVTVVLSGELGGGAVISPIFAEAGGELTVAPAFTGGVGLELGISYFALAAGLDAAITPGRTIEFAKADESANRDTSVLPTPWAGLGAYALRPTGRKPTLALLGTFGWTAPSHLGYGGRIVIGVPVDNRVTWFRIALGGSYGPQTTWKLDDDPVPLYSGYLRIGLGSRL